MLIVRRGPLARFVLVGVLLLPAVSSARAAVRCAVTTELGTTALAADLDLACRTVLAAVPSWDGRGVVRTIDGDPGVAAETLARVVSIHRASWSRLTPAGRQEVLTHELVHVATDAFTTQATPTWLVEGLAEAVALRGSGLADRVVAQELAAVVTRQHPRHARSGSDVAGLPTALPTARDFALTPALAYQESWLVVDLLLRHDGDAAVVRLYRAAGVMSLQRALSLHTVPALVAALRAEIVRRLS